MRDEMTATLNIYKWPSQAFWRYFELQALKQIEYDRPILEIGCGDGQFSSLVFPEIDEAIDVNPRSVEKCRRLANGLYRRVQCLDARELQFSEGGYGTIYANCVMEHIPDIQGVLAGCCRGLRPGGKLVILDVLVPEEGHSNAVEALFDLMMLVEVPRGSTHRVADVLQWIDAADLASPKMHKLYFGTLLEATAPAR